jgi:hypothetical protein
MSSSSPLAISTFQNLPTEIVLSICSHVSLTDLFFHVRLTCRLFFRCAHEVILPKFFNDSHAHVSWNSFCSLLSDLSMNVVLKDIKALFSTPVNLHTIAMSDRTRFARLAFREIYGQPKVCFSIGDEGGEITVKAQELQECLRFAPKGLQARRYAFLMFFFTRLRKERRSWRVTIGLQLAARMLGFTIFATLLFAVVSVILIVWWFAMEIHKMVKDMCRLRRWLYLKIRDDDPR